MPEIAALGWQAWGFASVGAARRSLYHAFHLGGYRLRTYKQAKRLQAGRRVRQYQKFRGEGKCQGRRVNYPGVGEPCKRAVPRGVRFCHQHDPRRKAERRVRLALARAARASRADPGADAP